MRRITMVGAGRSSIRVSVSSMEVALLLSDPPCKMYVFYRKNYFINFKSVNFDYTSLIQKRLF